MSYMIEITENKFDELVDNCEEMLRIGGKVMSCLDSIKHERMGNRIPMPIIVTNGMMMITIDVMKTVTAKDATTTCAVVVVTKY